MGEFSGKLCNARKNESPPCACHGHVEEPALLFELPLLLCCRCVVINSGQSALDTPNDYNQVRRKALGLVETHDTDIVHIARHLRLCDSRPKIVEERLCIEIFVG